MPADIRIEDLREPIFSDAQKMALEHTRSLRVDLSRESILDEAVARTGCEDFGSMDFLPRLDLLLAEWNADHGLSNIGRLSLRNKLLLYACNRLLINEILQRHPEIHQQEIARPIIVAGLPRSGTTHLLNLLAEDRRFHALPLWESYEPVPMPGEGMLEDGTDPRYQRCARQWQTMRQLTPHLAAMHPMDPDHIHEELELMGPDFASYNFEWLSMSPRWRDNYYASDQTPHYEYMKIVLKILQWQRGLRDGITRQAKSWVLKCPQHLEQLPVLKKVFPDAFVVITHRDPVSVIQSSVTMLAYGQRMNRLQVEPEQLVQYWSDRIEHLLRACVADRGRLSAAHSVDVPFHQFMSKAAETVESIYEKADMDIGEAARTGLQAYLDAHPRGKEGRMVYDLQSDFGVDPKVLRERFQFYFDHFAIRAEN